MTPKLDELPPVVLPQLAVVEIPGLVAPARCWMVPGQDWHGYAVPYFDHEQLVALLEGLGERGLAAGQLDDRGFVVLHGPAITGVYEVEPMTGLPEGREAERVWPVGAGRWPWREKTGDEDSEPLIGWPTRSPTPGILHVEPIEGRSVFNLVARLRDGEKGVQLGCYMTEADAERMALLWNQTLALDGLALAGGILERIVGDDTE